MRTERGFDRLLTFADAVVAIALTLLVLPLSELAADLGDENIGQVFSDPSLNPILIYCPSGRVYTYGYGRQ